MPLETPIETPGPDISSNVSIDKRRAKKVRASTIDPPQLPQTGRTPLNVTEIEQSSGKRSDGINKANVIEGKRTRKPNPRYAANRAWSAEEMSKFPQFHTAFMAGTARMTNQLRTDNLPDPPSHWRALLRHPYTDEFMKAANVEWEALFHKETWEIVDQDEAIQPIMPLKWVFTYKTDSDGYLAKFKARLVVIGDL